MSYGTETSSLSTLNGSTASRDCSSQVSSAKKPADSTTLLSITTRCATLTSAKTCTPCRAVRWQEHGPYVIIERMTKGQTALLHYADQGGATTRVNVVGVDWRIHLVSPQHARWSFFFLLWSRRRSCRQRDCWSTLHPDIVLFRTSRMTISTRAPEKNQHVQPNTPQHTQPNTPQHTQPNTPQQNTTQCIEDRDEKRERHVKREPDEKERDEKRETEGLM